MADVLVNGTEYAGVARVLLSAASGDGEVEFLLPNLQEKTAEAATSAVEVTPDAGYSGLSKVTVQAVTADVDKNIKAANIKKGVTILGVAGSIANYTGSVRVTPGASAQTLQTAGKIVPSNITVAAVDLSSHVAFGTLTTSEAKQTFSVTGLSFKPTKFLCALMPQMAGFSQDYAMALAWSGADSVEKYSYYTGMFWNSAAATFTAASGSLTVTAGGKTFPVGSYYYIAVG